MLTKMTEADWAVALVVFEAVRSRRGDKGRDDRKFLEALHYFSVRTITWRALPAEFGNWNSVWKCFWRPSKTGFFFDALASSSRSAHLIQMVDSTIVRAHISAAGARGRRKMSRSGVRAVAFPRKSTSRATSTGTPPASTSPPVRPVTPRASRHRSTTAST